MEKKMNERLQKIAEELEKGEVVDSVSVREFLRWFKAERRGASIVRQIRKELEELGLDTDPDFEFEYIDSPISIIPRGKDVIKISGGENYKLEGNDRVEIISEKESSSIDSSIDPTYCIRRLWAANQGVVRVGLEEDITAAITTMMANDFSQMPVMNNERDVKGIVSWKSIAKKICISGGGQKVKDFMVPHIEIGAEESIFKSIPIVAEDEYVLVRERDRVISGIITGADLSLKFKELSEPFLILSEVENIIRIMIDKRFELDEISGIKDPSDVNRIINSSSDLTLGEYIRLLENPDNWEKFGINVDRKIFCEHLNEVRNIRNEVMHFDPEGVDEQSLKKLREFSDFIKELRSLVF